MKIAQSLLGDIPAYVQITSRPQQCEALIENGTTLARRTNQQSPEYFICKHVMGGYVLNGPGVSNHHVATLAKARKIADLMAYEQQQLGETNGY